jgi:outer membrane autotransporter protein
MTNGWWPSGVAGGRRTLTYCRAVGFVLVGLCLGLSPAHATDVSDDQTQANNLVSQTVAPVVSSTMAGLIGDAIGGVFAGAGGPYASSGLLNTRNMEGMSAGDMPGTLGVWVNGAHTWIDNDDPGGEFDGGLTTAMAGLDYKFNDRFLLGLALGYEDTDIDTSFNAGRFDGDGITVAPYAAYMIASNVWVDLSGGYSAINYDTGRAGNTITGEFDADRYFINAGIAAHYLFDRVRLSPRASILYVTEDQDRYVESNGTVVGANDIDLGRASFGGELGYQLGDGIEPYLRAALEWDFAHEDGVPLTVNRLSQTHDVGGLLGGGVNLFLSDAVSANLEASSNSIGREDLDTYSVSGRLRISF